MYLCEKLQAKDLLNLKKIIKNRNLALQIKVGHSWAFHKHPSDRGNGMLCTLINKLKTYQPLSSWHLVMSTAPSLNKRKEELLNSNIKKLNKVEPCKSGYRWSNKVLMYSCMYTA